MKTNASDNTTQDCNWTPGVEAMKLLEPHGPAMMYMMISFVLSTFVLVSSLSRWPDIADIDPFDEHLARQIVNLTEAAYCADKLVDWDCRVCQNFPGMTNVTVLQGKSRNVRGFVGIDTGVDPVGVGRGDELRNGAAVWNFLEPDSSTGSTSSSSEAQQAAVDVDAAAAASLAAMAVTTRRRHLRAWSNRDYTTGPRKSKVVITFSGTDPKSIKNWIDDLEAAPIAHVYGNACEECKVHRGFLAAYGIVQDQVGGWVAKGGPRCAWGGYVGASPHDDLLVEASVLYTAV